MAKPKATPKAQASTPATTAEPQTSESTETQDTTIINVSDAAQAEEPQPEPEVAESASVEDAKPAAKQKKAEAPKTVTYKSAKVETSSYDIRVSNVKIRGHWDGAHEHLVFDVPAELAEGFEKHHHYQTGRVIKA